MALSKASPDRNQTVVEHIFTQTAEVIPMGIAPKAMGQILDRLTDAYTNPVEATVRELVSNAYDATALLPHSLRKPIEITTPNLVNSMFQVIDHGVGMSTDEVRMNYSQYGSSTKALDMIQVGAYGLGAKAPLAYCTEFTGETTKDGVTTTFKLARKAHGNEATITSVAVTDRPSGTRITVPAMEKDSAAFNRAVDIYRTYGFDSSFTIDGVTVTPDGYDVFIEDFVLDEDSGTTGRIFIKRDVAPALLKDFFQHWNASTSAAAVLSGWRYRIGLNGNYYRDTADHHFIIELKPGVVDFSNSRDEITVNDRLHALTSRFTGIFDTRASGVDAFAKIYRGLPKDEAQKLLLALARNYTIATAGDSVELTPVKGGHRTVSKVLPASFFDHPAGVDFMAYVRTAPTATVSAIYSCPNVSFYGGNRVTLSPMPKPAPSWHDSRVEWSSKPKAVANIQALLAAGPSEPLMEAVKLILDQQEKIHRPITNAVANFVAVVGVDPAMVNRILGWNDVKVKVDSGDDLLFIAEGNLETFQAQAKLLKATFGIAIKVKTIEELSAEAKALRPSAAPKQTAHIKARQFILGEGKTTEKRVLSGEAIDMGTKEVSVATILESRAVVIAYRQNPEQAFNGLLNAGVDLTGDIYLWDLSRDDTSRADFFKALGDYPRIFFGESFAGASKVAKELMAKQSYSANVLDHTLAGYSPEVLAYGYYFDIMGYPMEFLREHRKVIKKGDPLKAALGVVEKAKILEDAKGEAAIELSKIRINDVQLRKYAPEHAEELIAFTSTLMRAAHVSRVNVDLTANGLLNAICYLITHGHHYRKLQHEGVKNVKAPSDIIVASANEHFTKLTHKALYRLHRATRNAQA